MILPRYSPVGHLGPLAVTVQIVVTLNVRQTVVEVDVHAASQIGFGIQRCALNATAGIGCALRSRQPALRHRDAETLSRFPSHWRSECSRKGQGGHQAQSSIAPQIGIDSC